MWYKTPITVELSVQSVACLHQIKGNLLTRTLFLYAGQGLPLTFDCFLYVYTS